MRVFVAACQDLFGNRTKQKKKITTIFSRTTKVIKENKNIFRTLNNGLLLMT